MLKNVFNKNLVFILLLGVIASFYYNSFLTKGPQNKHVWRQADCLSLTKMYYEGADFWEPEMHMMLADDKTSSKSAGEFPILYYTVAQLWKVFGESYLVYRLFYLLILTLGIFCFYKTLQLLLKDEFWSMGLALLLFTSPVLASYGVSFLTDAPAFSFVLIGLYFISKYFVKQGNRFLYIAMIFFALGGLVKVSSLIAFFFLFSILGFETIFKIKTAGNRYAFDRNWKEWVSFIVVLIVIVSWYYYASIYNGMHHFKYTFNHIYPIWLMKTAEYAELIEGLKDSASHLFFSRSIIISMLLIFIFNLFLFKKIPLIAYLANILILVASALYFILWAPLMGIHDYYFIALLILFIGIFIPFVYFIKTLHPTIYKGNLTKVFFSTLLLINLLYCNDIMKLKKGKITGSFYFIGNQSFVDLMKWINWDYDTNLERFEKMRPYIDELGIKKDDLIVSIPDQSINVSLFLADRKGWTNYPNFTKTEHIEELIDKGAKYLFISKPEYLEKEFLKPFLTDSVGEYEGVKIYQLQ